MIPGRLAWLGGSTAVAVLAACALGCDKSNDFSGCANPAAGSQADACPESRFVTDSVAWRDLSGIIWRGENGVNGAVLGFAPLEPANTPSATTVTGTNGFFGPIHDVGLRYDLTARADQDVLVARGLTTRYAQLSFDGPHNLAGGYVKQLDIHPDPPIPADHTVVFFATGATAFGIVGDLDHGVTLVDQAFATNVTIHAVEYVRGKDLLTASAYGKADVFASAAVPQLVDIHLDPITDFADTTLSLAAPPGYTVQSAELLLVYSRSSLAHFTTMTLGQPIHLPVIPNRQSYAYKIHATAPDGSTADSGEQFLDFGKPQLTAQLYAAPTLNAPSVGASVDTTAVLDASGTGLFQHVLVPASGGGTIRVITQDALASLPDFLSVGAAIPKGTYTWTASIYPGISFPDDLAGVDAGRYQAVATSKPRSLVFK